MDTNGNSMWQQATPYGHPNLNNLIEYKQIDTLTDMIVASSGSSYISYNRIVSLSTSPFTVSTTQTSSYRDPIKSLTRGIRALFIVDINNARSLIYDSSTKVTDLAIINFSTKIISFKKTFPLMNSQRSLATFVSETEFYVGTYSS